MRIGTHDGIFHADDVFSMSTMDIWGVASDIVRTRDSKVLAGCHIRVDVGGRNDASTGDYDHHQKGGAGIRDNGIPYAAFGLIWKQYGEQICGSKAVAKIVEERLVQVVDARDCGKDIYAGLKMPDVVPYAISDAILVFNPGWLESSGPNDFDHQFLVAMKFARIILEREIILAKGMEAVNEFVRTGLDKMSDPRVLILDRFCPWQNAVIENAPQVLFILFPSETGAWRIQAVPSTKGSFALRRSLPANWAGKVGLDLAEITGVEDASFCHPNLFIAGAQSKEGVQRLSELALA